MNWGVDRASRGSDRGSSRGFSRGSDTTRVMDSDLRAPSRGISLIEGPAFKLK